MSEFDKDLKVGDLITAYHKGYHQITKIERRFVTEADNKYRSIPQVVGKEYNALITYIKVLNDKYTKASAISNSCDAGFCTKLTRHTLIANREQVISDVTRGTKLLLELIGVIE